jgi:hypothetical protein
MEVQVIAKVIALEQWNHDPTQVSATFRSLIPFKKIGLSNAQLATKSRGSSSRDTLIVNKDKDDVIECGLALFSVFIQIYPRITFIKNLYPESNQGLSYRIARL